APRWPLQVRSLVLAATLSGVIVVRPAAADPAGFAFLEVPGGARAAAMGGAFASIARGAEAAFWNPAGLATFNGAQFTATHTETYEHLRHDDAALAGRLFGGGLAASVRALYSEPITERDDLGNEIGSFGSHDLEFLLGYGHRLSGGLEFGVTGQVLRERIADLGTTTWAMGGGIAKDLGFLPGGRASLSVHNLGPSGHYEFNGEKGAPI